MGDFAGGGKRPGLGISHTVLFGFLCEQMAEEGFGAKVRVVRCPRCEKLLPELANFSFYRCGSCGATLQAKTPSADSGGSPESTKGESAKYLEVLDHVTEIKELGSERSLETDHEGSRTESKLTESSPQGASCSHSKSVSANEDDVIERDTMTSELDGLEKETGTNITVATNDQNLNATEMSKTDEEKGIDAAESVQIRVEKLDELDRTPRVPMASAQSLRCSGDVGPSTYHSNARHLYGKNKAENQQNVDDARRVDYLEQDRVKLLRMLDELRDQVQRTCEASDRQKTSVTLDKKTSWPSSYAYDDHANWFPENSSSLNLNPSQCLAATHDHNAGGLNFCSNMPAQSHLPGYGDPFAHRRVPLHLGDYAQRQLDTFGYGQLDPDHVMPYHHDGFYHQPACSCLHCYQRPFPVPTRAPTAIFDHQRYPYPATNHDFYTFDGPSSFGSRSYNLKPGNAPLPRLEPRPYHRTMFSKNAARSCRSIDGAAPFTICSNCFELLQLPEKSFLLKKNKFSLRCGSCFKLLCIKYEGSRFVISSATASSCSENQNSSNNSPINYVQSSDEKLVLPYTFSINDSELIEKGHGLRSSESDKTHVLSLSSTTSGFVESPESAISPKDVPTSSAIPFEKQMISRVPSLPLREHFGYSHSDQSTDGSGNGGSRSVRSAQGRNMCSGGNLRQNSAKDVQVAAEMDLSDDENVPANLSQDSWDKISKDEVQSRVIKSSDSFFAGLLKKSFRPFNQSLGHSGCKVSVNGHPISDNLIKKAEKLAGPISPGNYWYDYRAGFWGVMGHPCLGIIPPFIEEFNYPMPKNCAGGDTGVVVNGRELHQKDMELLVGRGLPSGRGGCYIIDISGKVWDELSGEELDCLGKLAPTIEKVKHGFGMSVPKVIASSVTT